MQEIQGHQREVRQTYQRRELGWVLPGGAGKEGQGAGRGGEGGKGGEEEEKRAGSRRGGGRVGGRVGGDTPGDGACKVI